MTRRELMQAALALAVVPNVAGAAPHAVPRRKLGRTGVTVSALGMGGAHLGTQSTEAETIRLIRAGIDAGLDFLDNCWDYHDGESERRMGKALRDGYRERVFLMTKIDGRDRKTAAKQIDESLRRLQTDRLDLLQLHEVIHQKDPARAFEKDSAIDAMRDAQKAGKARFIGFTGHKSADLHLAMLERAKAAGFRYDAVQLPLNVFDAHTDGFEKRVLPVLVREEIAVLGMKPMAAPYIVKSGAATAEECLRYALTLPTSVVITGIDAQPILDQALKVARGFKPLAEAEVEALLARTAKAAKDPQWEKYKNSTWFDGTVRRPEWLGPTPG